MARPDFTATISDHPRFFVASQSYGPETSRTSRDKVLGDKIGKQWFRTRGDPVVNGTNDGGRGALLFQRSQELPRAGNWPLDEPGNEDAIENVDHSRPGGLAEGIGTNHRNLILIGGAIGPQLYQLAHLGNHRAAFLNSTGVDGRWDGHPL